MKYLSLLILVLLTACGGGGSGTSAPTPPQQAVTPQSASTTPATPNPYVILMRGDSTNYGCTNACAGRVANPPAVELQRLMDARYGGGRVVIIDSAQPGSTLANDLNGEPNVWPSLATQLAAYHPQMVMTNSELNDRNTLDDATYKSQLIQWIQTVQGGGALPVLTEPNPTCPNILVTRNDQAFVQDMNAVGVQMGVTVIPNWSDWFNTPVWWVPYLNQDCVHPTQQGYDSKVTHYFAGLTPILDPLITKIN